MACIGQRRSAYRVSMGKPEGNTSLGGPECRWGANIKTNLQEIGFEAGTVYVSLWADSCECRDETLDSVKCGEFLDYRRNCLLLKKDSAS